MSAPKVSPETAALILSYRDGAASDLATQQRLSVQYGIGAGLMALAAIVLQVAWLSLGVWAIFVVWLILRMRASRAHAKDVARALNELQQGSQVY
ncbi:hypothetical protein [Pseudopelagicola sp. nBUS_19]|mgnify:CR=1 FL=1|uniref:hypothetical protein n=1 Tax=Pseudopelagicola sp. nBUS_19 TaxID=3395316 RepID=UPI003EBCB53E